MRHAILITLIAAEVAAYSLIEGLRFGDTGGWPLYFAEHIRRPLDEHAPILLLALAMGVAVSIRGFDLSVAAIAAAVGCLMALFPAGDAFWYTAVPAGLLLGVTLGAVNGAMAGRGRMRAAIVTLIAMAAYRGLAFALPDASPEPFGMVGGYVRLGETGGIVMIAIGTYLAVGLAIRRGRWARRLAALRGAVHVAPTHEVPPRRVRAQAYALGGLIAAITGIMYSSHEFAAEPMAMAGDELWAIAALVWAGWFADAPPRARTLALFEAALAAAIFVSVFEAIGVRWGEAAGWDLSLLRWPIGAAAVAAVWWTDRRRGRRRPMTPAGLSRAEIMGDVMR